MESVKPSYTAGSLQDVTISSPSTRMFTETNHKICRRRCLLVHLQIRETFENECINFVIITAHMRRRTSGAVVRAAVCVATRVVPLTSDNG
jgi:hypothetical protein